MKLNNKKSKLLRHLGSKIIQEKINTYRKYKEISSKNNIVKNQQIN